MKLVCDSRNRSSNDRLILWMEVSKRSKDLDPSTYKSDNKNTATQRQRNEDQLEPTGIFDFLVVIVIGIGVKFFTVPI